MYYYKLLFYILISLAVISCQKQEKNNEDSLAELSSLHENPSVLIEKESLYN